MRLCFVNLKDEGFFTFHTDFILRVDKALFVSLCVLFLLCTKLMPKIFPCLSAVFFWGGLEHDHECLP